MNKTDNIIKTYRDQYSSKIAILDPPSEDRIREELLHELQITLVDCPSKADFSFEANTTADGYEIWIMYDNNNKRFFDIMENVFYYQDGWTDKILETIKEETGSSIYIDCCIEDVIDDSLAVELAESMGIVQNDDWSGLMLDILGEEHIIVENESEGEMVFCTEYDDRADDIGDCEEDMLMEEAERQFPDEEED